MFEYRTLAAPMQEKKVCQRNQRRKHCHEVIKKSTFSLQSQRALRGQLELNKLWINNSKTKLIYYTFLLRFKRNSVHTHKHRCFADLPCALHTTKSTQESLKHESSCVCSIYWQDLIELSKTKTNSIMSVVSQRQTKTGNQIQALPSWACTLSLSRKERSNGKHRQTQYAEQTVRQIALWKRI